MSKTGHTTVRALNPITEESRSLVSKVSVHEKESAQKRGKSCKRVIVPTAAKHHPSKRVRRSVQDRNVQPWDAEGKPGEMARTQGFTKLEMKSISVESLEQYGTYLQRFRDFCKVNGGVETSTAENTDMWLADYMDVMFAEGRGAHDGEKTLAAVEFATIAFKGKLFRSRRALRGWRKLRPALSRLPLPRLLMMGIAMELLAMGQAAMALMVLVAFFLYLRPGEAIDVLRRHVVPPVRMAGNQYAWVTVVIRDSEGLKPDKVGVFDNSIPFDTKKIAWIGDVLLQKAQALKKADQKVFPFSMEDFRKAFQKAGASLGVEQLHPYQLRHGGATEDLGSKQREFSVVKARARWKSDQSVRRYAKVGRMQQLLSKMPEVSKRFCQWSELNIEKVFRGKIAAKSIRG